MQGRGKNEKKVREFKYKDARDELQRSIGDMIKLMWWMVIIQLIIASVVCASFLGISLFFLRG